MAALCIKGCLRQSPPLFSATLCLHLDSVELISAISYYPPYLNFYVRTHRYTKRICDSATLFPNCSFLPSIFGCVFVMRRFFVVAKRERTEQLTGSLFFSSDSSCLPKFRPSRRIVEDTSITMAVRVCKFARLSGCFLPCGGSTRRWIVC